MRIPLLLLFLLAAAINALQAYNDWFLLFHRRAGLEKVLALPLTEVDHIRFSRIDQPAGDSDPASCDEPYDFINVMHRDSTEYLTFPLDSVISMEVGTNIPTLRIITDSYVEEIPDKENYLSARFILEGYEAVPDIDTEVNIRGRGNTSWTEPKKPYRLKFKKKISVAGLKESKNYVLVANYVDRTLMRNAVAFKVAELLGVPFTNHCIPVNLWLNGRYRGQYMLSEKLGINKASVNIDETTGVLWEMDAYYDEDYRFRTTAYDLPCQIKDPDFDELYEEGDLDIPPATQWKMWREDLDYAVSCVEQGRWEKAFDCDATVRYFLANSIVGNHEVRYPKSVFLHKGSIGEKYTFGPVWDFDWAFGFEVPANVGLLWWKGEPGENFLQKIFSSALFQKEMMAALRKFRQEGLPELMRYIDEYAAMTRASALQDGDLWPSELLYGDREISAERFDENVEELRQYLLDRIDYISTSRNFGLY